MQEKWSKKHASTEKHEKNSNTRLISFRPAAAGFRLLTLTLLVLVSVLFILQTESAATTRYWIGLSADGNWGDASWNTSSDGTGSPGVPVAGDTANIWQPSSTADLRKVIYNSTTYSSSAPLGSLSIKNSFATGHFPSDTGVGWIMLNQTAGVMDTYAVGIGPLGIYKIDNGTLNVRSKYDSGSSTWATGVLGMGGFKTDMDGGQPYEGGVLYQTGGTIQAAAMSIGWRGSVSKPGDGIAMLLNGSLTIADDTSGGTIATTSPPVGNIRVGEGGQGDIWQGFGLLLPATGAVYSSDVHWTTGTGGTVTTDNLYVGTNHYDSSTSTMYYGKGSYSLLSGIINVNKNMYIGFNGTSTGASRGSFEQGYVDMDNNYTTAMRGDGSSRVSVAGDLLLGTSQGPGTMGGSGNYELYNGTLTVGGSGTTHPSGTSGGIYIGFASSQRSNFTQGQPYQDTSGNWITSSVEGLTNSVSAPNLYIGFGNSTYTPQYALADGTLDISGNTYIGWSGSGIFSQGQGWIDSGTSLLTPGGVFNNTGKLYLGYNSSANGSYNLVDGVLIVSGGTYIGWSGSGNFTQGVMWSSGGVPTLAPGGVFSNTAGGLYLGYNAGSNGNYTLADGTLSVRGGTYIGWNGSGNFSQGIMWDSGTPVPTPGGVFNNTGNLYVGYNAGSNGNYMLADGTLAVSGKTYIGWSGWGNFNQGVIWNSGGVPTLTPGGVFTNTGNLYLGYNTGSNGSYTLADGTLTVRGSVYVGNSGTGSFTQGQVWNGPTPVPTAGGIVNIINGGNLYLGASAGGIGNYNLYNGSLNVAGNTYIGSTGGSGTFNQSGGSHKATNIIVGSMGTYNYQAGTVTGNLQNSGQVSLSALPGSTATGTFGASIANNAGGTVNANTVAIVFSNSVTNAAGGTVNVNGGTVRFDGAADNSGIFSIGSHALVTFASGFTNRASGNFYIHDSTVTFNGTMTNLGTWNIDPSTIIFTGNFIQGGTITSSSGDTFEFTSGTHTFDLGGTSIFLGQLILDPGAVLNFTGLGTLNLGGIVYGAGSTINLNGTAMNVSSVPVPGAAWLLVPGLSLLGLIRRKIRK